MGSHVAPIRPPNRVYRPSKALFELPVCTVVDKIWLAYSHHSALIRTQVLSHFFFDLDPQTNDRGLRCYSPTSKIGPPIGPHQRVLNGFQAGMGWLKNCDFG